MATYSYIFKTKPGLGILVIGVSASIGFGFLDYGLAFSKWDFNNVSHITGYAIQFSFIAIVTLMLGSGLWTIIGFKLYWLTDEELFVIRPLIFSRRVIELSDIVKVYNEDYTIKISDNKKLFEKDKDRLEVYRGRKVIILLKNGKKLELTSLEVSGYKELSTQINKQLQNLRKQHLT